MCFQTKAAVAARLKASCIQRGVLTSGQVRAAGAHRRPAREEGCEGWGCASGAIDFTKRPPAANASHSPSNRRNTVRVAEGMCCDDARHLQ